MDYKETLLLPKTDFPMRGNLPQNEPKRYQAWFENGVYDQMKRKREGAPMFTLHDGPPYANGDIHIGHALNKILKDIILKYNYFQGKAVRMTPGWDCHGLPIEQKVEEKIGKEKKEAMPTEKFRELCRAHAAKFVDIQREGFKSLGVIADWEDYGPGTLSVDSLDGGTIEAGDGEPDVIAAAYIIWDDEGASLPLDGSAGTITINDITLGGIGQIP